MDNRTLGIVIAAPAPPPRSAGPRVMAGGPGRFGRLPGDARRRPGGVRGFFPLTPMPPVSGMPGPVPGLVRRFS